MKARSLGKGRPVDNCRWLRTIRVRAVIRTACRPDVSQSRPRLHRVCHTRRSYYVCEFSSRKRHIPNRHQCVSFTLGWARNGAHHRFGIRHIRPPRKKDNSRCGYSNTPTVSRRQARHDVTAHTFGCHSKTLTSSSFTTWSTMPLTSGFPSLFFVCPSNSGSGTLTLITAVNP